MGTLNSAWNLVTGTLEANQAALNVVANNTANANTPGYTRETAVWRENDPVTISGQSYGRGASMTGASSQRDRVLEQRIQQQTQTSAAASTRLTALDQVQALFNETAAQASGTASGGIASSISGFFDSLAQLEASPSDNALRQQVLTSAGTLAESFQNASANLASQQSALDQQGATLVSQVNALTQSIADLNRRIMSGSPASDAGVLEDQRQQALTQLSQLIGIHQIQSSSNGITITTSAGDVLVSGMEAVPLSTGTVAGQTHFFAGGTDLTASLTAGGGQLGGILTVRDQDIPGFTKSLDQLAYSISTKINAQNNVGTDMAGDNGGAGNIFAAPAAVAGAAAGMSVVMTDIAYIAAAGSGLGSQDNGNAVAMAGLGTSPIVSGQTPAGYYSGFVTSLGSLVSGVGIESTAQSASLTQLQNQRDALSAVNLDEEAAAMGNLERSYQAASKVFSILNSVMASALNLGQETTVA